MRRLPIPVFVMLLFAGPARAATAVLDSAAVIAKARDLRAAFSLENASWREFDEKIKG
jgi:uncharacterized protein YciI